MIVCITGMPGSGKTVAAELLKRKRFDVVEMGDIVRGMMHERGLQITNKSFREFALKLREKHGRTAVAREVVKKIKRRRGNIGISGIRSIYEIEYFKKNLDNITVIAVAAPKTLRFMRLRKRGRVDDPKNEADFEYRERKEKRFGLRGAISGADYVVPNTGTVAQLEARIEEVMEKCMG